jgi:carboxylesterase
MKQLFTLAVISLLLSSCGKEPSIPADYLGGGVLKDSSIYNPQAFLLSVSKPNPTAAEALKPVIITCHGYSASTFEWSEFRAFTAGRTDLLLSNVLLAGHGTSYNDFKKSTWRDWQASIKAEYTKLVSAGYRNIHFAASSTSCPLLLDLVHSGFFNNTTNKMNLFLVDPVIIPSNKSLSLIGIVGPVLGYVEGKDEAGEEKFYYHYRPQETLQELQDLLNVTRRQLQSGFRLPANLVVKVYKSKKDPTADPVSAVLIYKGLKTATGAPIDLEMINSSLHVFTRLNLVPNVTSTDGENQLHAFREMVTRIF